MAELVRYDAMCRAIAECRSVDEVVAIRDPALQLRAAARIAKNRKVVTDCDAVIARAERHVGHLMAAQAEAVGKAKGGGEKGVGRRGNAGSDTTRITPPSLAEGGIDKNLAHRARTMASIDEAAFEKVIADRHDGDTPLMSRLNALADALVDRELNKGKPRGKRSPTPKPSPDYDPWSKLSHAVRDVLDAHRSTFAALARQSRRVGFLDIDVEHARAALDHLSHWHTALIWEATHGEAPQHRDRAPDRESADRPAEDAS